MYPEPKVKVWRWREPGPNGRSGHHLERWDAMQDMVWHATGQKVDDSELLDCWLRLSNLSWTIRWEFA